MTDATGCLSSLEKDRNTVTPHCHFGRSGEISLPYAANRLRLSRLPSGMYLSSLPSLASCTEILHFVQNDDPGRKAPQRVASFPAPMTPMQHRPPVISSGGQRKMMKSFHEVSETESRNLTPLCCPPASPLPPSCRQVFTIIAVTRETLIKSLSDFILVFLFFKHLCSLLRFLCFMFCGTLFQLLHCQADG